MAEWGATANTRAGGALTGASGPRPRRPAQPQQPRAAPHQSRAPLPQPARVVRKDLRILATFIRIYCEGQHRGAVREPVTLRHYAVGALCGSARRPRLLRLCPTCRKLLQHAFVKRVGCPLDPKPACKHCPTHCYAPRYREEIRAVMRYAGRRLVLSGRLDYLWHLLF
ncbi:MAG: nitrous oxide-stimulated promoter family protein [Planctomycetota bacterium]